MSKVAVVYWSGTGNTEAMADFVVQGAKKAGADVSVLQLHNLIPIKWMNLTQLLLAARQWEQNSLRILSLSQCLLSADQS